ncbi:MAG: hypothetical protein ACRD1W_12515, partial [Vicinamibacterales bacterium]
MGERSGGAIGGVLLGLCLFTSGFTLLIALTGGFTIHVFGARLSVHATWRPIAVALACGAAAVALLRTRAYADDENPIAHAIVHRYGIAV